MSTSCSSAARAIRCSVFWLMWRRDVFEVVMCPECSSDRWSTLCWECSEPDGDPLVVACCPEYVEAYRLGRRHTVESHRG